MLTAVVCLALALVFSLTLALLIQRIDGAHHKEEG